MLQRVLGSYVCVWIYRLFLVNQLPNKMCLGDWERLNFYITFCIWSTVEAIVNSIRNNYCLDTVYHINLTQRWL